MVGNSGSGSFCSETSTIACSGNPKTCIPLFMNGEETPCMEVFTNFTDVDRPWFLVGFVSNYPYHVAGLGLTGSAIPKCIQNTPVLVLESYRYNPLNQGVFQGSTTFRRVSGSPEYYLRYLNHRGRLSGKRSGIYESHHQQHTEDLYCIFPINLEWCEPG